MTIPSPVWFSVIDYTGFALTPACCDLRVIRGKEGAGGAMVHKLNSDPYDKDGSF